MKFGSLFAGIGGLDLGLERAGMECRWQVEIDDYCNKILSKHWPDVPKYKDVREVGKENLEAVDLICGGFPCQPVSIAGQKRGCKDERWLWEEFIRIICDIEPRWVLIENVRNLLSIESGRLFGGILKDLAKGGYNVQWRVLGANDLGAFHKRERVFILAYPKSFRLEATSIWKGNDCESSVKKPDEWELFLPIPAGAHYIDERWKNFESVVCGDDDGIPHRVDRLKALGNAVVPQVAEYVGRCIMEFDKGGDDL